MSWFWKKKKVQPEETSILRNPPMPEVPGKWEYYLCGQCPNGHKTYATGKWPLNHKELCKQCGELAKSAVYRSRVVEYKLHYGLNSSWWVAKAHEEQFVRWQNPTGWMSYGCN